MDKSSLISWIWRWILAMDRVCLVCFLLLWENTVTRRNSGMTRFIWSDSFSTLPITKGNRVHNLGRNLEAETEAEALGTCCLMAGATCSITHLRTTCPGVALPTKRRTPTLRWYSIDLPASRSAGDIWSIKVPASQMTMTWVKVTQS